MNVARLRMVPWGRLLTLALVTAASVLLATTDTAGRLFALKALGVGAAGGLAGGLIAGAIGLVSVPLIVLFLGLPVHQAIGTNLFQTIFTAASGAQEHHRRGNVSFRLAAPLLAGALLFAPLGALVSLRLSETLLHALFSGILAVMAVRLAHRTLRGTTKPTTGFHLGDMVGDRAGARMTAMVAAVFGPRVAGRMADAVGGSIEGEFRGHRYRIDRITPVLLGAAIGFVSGLLGIGGGFLVTPLVAGILQVPTHLAVGTGLVVITGNSLFGSAPHLLGGTVVLVAAVFLSLGGAVGARIGTRLGHHLSDRALYGLFTVLLVVVAVRMAPWP